MSCLQLAANMDSASTQSACPPDEAHQDLSCRAATSYAKSKSDNQHGPVKIKHPGDLGMSLYTWLREGHGKTDAGNTSPVVNGQISP